MTLDRSTPNGHTRNHRPVAALGVAAVAVGVLGAAGLAPVQAAAPVSGTAVRVGLPTSTVTASFRKIPGLAGAPTSLVGTNDIEGNLVVGSAQPTPWTRDGAVHAFIYDLSEPNARPRDLGTFGERPGIGASSVANAIDDGVVVGYAEGTSTPGHAFAYDTKAPAPVLRDLGTIGGGLGQSMATGINGHVVIGWSGSHAFAYDLDATTPVMRDLGSLGGQNASATRIVGNLIIGYSDTATGDRHPFVYDLSAANPVMRDLGSLGGKTGVAFDVSGTRIVGSAQNADGLYHAFVYDLASPNPVMRDLGVLPDANVSTSGPIVGDTLFGGSGHAFSLDLASPSAQLRDLGSLGGPYEPDSTGNTKLRVAAGDFVYGSSSRAGDGAARAVVYDRAAADPELVDLPGGTSPSVPAASGHCPGRRPRRSGLQPPRPASRRASGGPRSPWSGPATHPRPSRLVTRPGRSPAPRRTGSGTSRPRPLEGTSGRRPAPFGSRPGRPAHGSPCRSSTMGPPRSPTHSWSR